MDSTTRVLEKREQLELCSVASLVDENELILSFSVDKNILKGMKTVTVHHEHRNSTEKQVPFKDTSLDVKCSLRSV